MTPQRIAPFRKRRGLFLSLLLGVGASCALFTAFLLPRVIEYPSLAEGAVLLGLWIAHLYLFVDIASSYSVSFHDLGIRKWGIFGPKTVAWEAITSAELAGYGGGRVLLKIGNHQLSINLLFFSDGVAVERLISSYMEGKRAT